MLDPTVKQARREVVPPRDRADARARRHGFTYDQKLLRLAPYPPCRNDRKTICRPGSRHRHGPISIADLKPSQRFILLRKAVAAGWTRCSCSRGSFSKSLPRCISRGAWSSRCPERLTSPAAFATVLKPLPRMKVRLCKADVRRILIMRTSHIPSKIEPCWADASDDGALKR